MNRKKQSVVRRSAGASPVVVYPAKDMVGIYVFNDQFVPPLKLYTGWPGLTCLPDDEPEQATVDMLKKTFPEAKGYDLLRLEDYIRHNPMTLVCKCGRKAAPAIVEKLQELNSNIRVEYTRIYRNLNKDMLPPLNGAQYNVCMPCSYFSLDGNIAGCSKRWCCKWGASKPVEWDVTNKHIPYHSQCALIERHFRFETAFLYWTEKFPEEVANEKNFEFFSAVRNYLLRRDLRAAAEHGELSRILRRCSDLGESFAEFASKEDVLKRMLSFWQVNRKLLENVRLLLKEGISITPEWRDELLQLSGEKELVAELRQLLQ